MRPPLKLSAIDQEHLQELYDTAGVARDELPYADSFTALCEGFQDRTFKNAHPEQVFGAILKYVRSSGNSATEQPASTLTEEQAKLLKGVMSRHGGAKMLPYSDEFDSARAEFNKLAKAELTEHEFWRSIQSSQGAKRRPPPPRRKKVTAKADDDDDVE
jgi:hypothetical protein